MSEEAILELAKEMGYNPDYDGEGKKTPAEFIKYSNKIVKDQSGKIKDLMKTVEDMSSGFVNMQKTFNQTIEANAEKHKAALEKQRQDLESKFETAVDEADSKEANRIRKEISNIDKELDKKPEKQEINDAQAYFNEWRKDKDWLEKDKKAQVEFQKARLDVMSEHGENLDVKFELKEIDKILKNKYPEKYGLKPMEKPPAGGVTEGGKSDTKTSKEVKLSTLNAEEKALYNQMKKASGKKFNEKSVLNAIGKIRESKEK